MVAVLTMRQVLGGGSPAPGCVSQLVGGMPSCCSGAAGQRGLRPRCLWHATDLRAWHSVSDVDQQLRSTNRLSCARWRA